MELEFNKVEVIGFRASVNEYVFILEVVIELVVGLNCLEVQALSPIKDYLEHTCLGPVLVLEVDIRQNHSNQHSQKKEQRHQATRRHQKRTITVSLFVVLSYLTTSHFSILTQTWVRKLNSSN